MLTGPVLAAEATPPERIGLRLRGLAPEHGFGTPPEQAIRDTPVVAAGRGEGR